MFSDLFFKIFKFNKKYIPAKLVPLQYINSMTKLSKKQIPGMTVGKYHLLVHVGNQHPGQILVNLTVDYRPLDN